MIRRDELRSLGLAAAGSAGHVVTGRASAESPTNPLSLPAPGDYAEPWNPPDPEIPDRRRIAAIPDDYFTPGRFAGKTVLVTGCARGMGRGAAFRLARAGALVAARNAEAGPNPNMGRIKTQSILSYADQNRRPASVAEQVGMMVYLLSPDLGNITGATLSTDGGWTAY